MDDKHIEGSCDTMLAFRQLNGLFSNSLFSHSNQKSELLEQQQRKMDPHRVPLKMIQDVVTRWWSTYKMVSLSLSLSSF